MSEKELKEMAFNKFVIGLTNSMQSKGAIKKMRNHVKLEITDHSTVRVELVVKDEFDFDTLNDYKLLISYLADNYGG